MSAPVLWRAAGAPTLADRVLRLLQRAQQREPLSAEAIAERLGTFCDIDEKDKAYRAKVARLYAEQARAELARLADECPGLRPRCEAKLAELDAIFKEADVIEAELNAPEAPVVELAARRGAKGRGEGGTQ